MEQFKYEYDGNGYATAFVWNNNPNHQNSWRRERDSEGRVVSCTYANDPNNKWSWRQEHSKDGYVISVTFSNDPSNKCSWSQERDSEGRVIAYTQANDPSHPNSWRGEFLFELDGYNVILLTDGRIKVGCQVHTIDHWRENWKEIADADGMNVETARLGMEKLESLL
jgi:hypothetical protein